MFSLPFFAALVTEIFGKTTTIWALIFYAFIPLSMMTGGIVKTNKMSIWTFYLHRHQVLNDEVGFQFAALAQHKTVAKVAVT